MSSTNMPVSFPPAKTAGSTSFNANSNTSKLNSSTSGDSSPLLNYLNETEHTGTVPALPLKEPDSLEQPVTTKKVTETVITQRPTSDQPAAPRKTAYAKETTVSQQVPRAGERFSASEVQNHQIEPVHPPSRETEERINEMGVGPVALQPLVENDSSVARGMDTVASGAQVASNTIKSKSQAASDTVKSKSQAASKQIKSTSQAASNTLKSKTQQASEQLRSTAAAAQHQMADVQHTLQDQFTALKTKVTESLQGNENAPGLVERISGSVREVTNNAAEGVRRTADTISKNEKVQQTVPTVVEAATSSYFFVTAFLTQYIRSFRPFMLVMLRQPMYVQIISGLSLFTHGILPIFYLDKWLAHTVLQCYVLSVFLSHLIFTTTGNLRLLFAAHIAMLPIMWSLFWETESQSSSLASLRDQIHAGNAASILTHPMAIRHYTYVLWTRLVGFVTTSIFTLDFSEIDSVWKRSASQRASIAHSISKRLPHRSAAKRTEVGASMPVQENFDEEATFDEIPIGEVEDMDQDYDSLLTQDNQRSDEDFSAQNWQQKPFDFDEFMDQSHLTKQTVMSEEKPDKSFDSYDKSSRFNDAQRLDNFSDNQKIYQAPMVYPVSQTITSQTTTTEIL
jgi:hypothetical protein